MKHFFLVLTMLFCQISNASVVINGSRIVYSSNLKEKNIDIKNNDSFPNLVQIWTDYGDYESTPEYKDMPFLVLPSVAKINSESGQSFRLLYVGDELPSDRESVFYLNMTQVPYVKKEVKDNKLIIMFKSRIKIFYRPEGLSMEPHSLPSLLDFKLVDNGDGISLKINNPSPYYVTFNSIEIEFKEESKKIIPSMIEPFNSLVISLFEESTNINKDEVVRINFKIINDLGALVKGEREVTF